MDPQLKALADRYQWRLINDPTFSFKVKTVFRVLRSWAGDKDINEVRAAAYLLTCVLEEANRV